MHHKAGDDKPLYLGHPLFEGFEVRQTVGRGKADMARTASTWHLEPFVTLHHFTVPFSTPTPRVGKQNGCDLIQALAMAKPQTQGANRICRQAAGNCERVIGGAGSAVDGLG